MNQGIIHNGTLHVYRNLHDDMQFCLNKFYLKMFFLISLLKF